MNRKIDDNVYYNNIYWGSFDLVSKHINKTISDDENKVWYLDFYNYSKKRTFKKALILNCGNGRVEREILSQIPLFEECVGIDISKKFIKKCKEEAKKNNLNFRYYQMDINKSELPEDSFDLVINHAALHHISHLKKVLLGIYSKMTKDSFFVNYDYVGPHRNQYPYKDYSTFWQTNKSLPTRYQKKLSYAHLPTMLATDYSEAIHSELILTEMANFFNFKKHKKFGGTIAYNLLYDNINLLKDQHTRAGNKAIKQIIDEDVRFTSETGISYFDYFVCTKKHSINQNAVKKGVKLEIERENIAKKNGGIYYENTLLQDVFLRLSDLEYELKVRKQIEKFSIAATLIFFVKKLLPKPLKSFLKNILKYLRLR